VPACSVHRAVALCPGGWVATGGALSNHAGTIVDEIAFRDAYLGLVYNNTPQLEKAPQTSRTSGAGSVPGSDI
jgi:hypothetical protein